MALKKERNKSQQLVPSNRKIEDKSGRKIPKFYLFVYIYVMNNFWNKMLVD